MGSKSSKQHAETNERFFIENTFSQSIKSKRSTLSSRVRPDVVERDIHEKCKRMLDAQEDQLNKAEKKVQRIKNENAEKLKTLWKQRQTENENMRISFEKQLTEKDKEIATLNEKLYFAEEEKDGFLSRFSEIAGAKLTEGNANIADLSDANRPVKLAEKYSELYDNEWTDAFDDLTEKGKRSEEKASKILAKSFCVAYTVCRNKAIEDLDNITDALRKYHGVTDLPTEILKEIKDQRKKFIGRPISDLRKLYKGQAKTNIFKNKSDRNVKSRKIFVTKSLELCWLMAIQDPPVFVDINIDRQGENMNTDLWKPYTTSGKYIEFIVWPTLFLQEGGNVLLKGVAQGMSVNNKVETQNNEEERNIELNTVDETNNKQNNEDETNTKLTTGDETNTKQNTEDETNNKQNTEVASNSLTDDMEKHPMYSLSESRKANTSDKSGTTSNKRRKKKRAWSRSLDSKNEESSQTMTKTNIVTPL